VPEFIGSESDPSAIIVRNNESVEGIQFFTPGNFPQQMGLMSRPAGYVVPRHKHNLVPREIELTQEVLLLRKGTMNIEISLDDGLIETVQLVQGDIILLAKGEHRVTMLNDCEILEVKQGPYAGPNDKTITE
jgi:hypothetical protein